MLSAFQNVLEQAFSGPLRFGALAAFVVAASPVSCWDLPAAVWALVAGSCLLCSQSATNCWPTGDSCPRPAAHAVKRNAPDRRRDHQTHPAEVGTDTTHNARKECNHEFQNRRVDRAQPRTRHPDN